MLAAFYEQPPPSILHHYTDAGGLLGIAKGQQLWATHIRYMNDAREFVHAIDLAKEYVKRLRSASDSTVLLTLAEILDTMPGNTFVISFSGEENLLSQWRGYCPSGGYSLDFDTSKLQQFADEQRFHLVKCTYVRGQQEQLVQSLVDDAIREFPDYRPGFDYPAEMETGHREIIFAGLWFFPKMQRLASAMKDPAFSTENEWRLVGGLQKPLPPIGLRVRGSVLVPYEIFRLHSGEHAGEELEGVITQVLVGPNPEQELARFGAERLAQCGYIKGVPINVSRIPYRNALSR